MGMILAGGGGTLSASQEELEVIVARGGGILRCGQTDLDILPTKILTVVGDFVLLLVLGQAGLEVAVAVRVLDEAVQEAGPG